ncbi:glycosyltransferase family 39 protein [Solirubrobacter ginsenosidimutans]|uniref:Glycosyltransferase family 39 protein n=1 Tax=Solirubrobacter ginsenosidimutans TaxID=490573 RepID=A0A9X3S056_9ACTN|nr:glycosyltransferase family 39 protein [Solirubrobacter ginsenosidimutans]MDA0161685.1 glycosyltransferase family 39 protein [Solirubrobacter ginsenosidimutans]
MSAPLVLDGGAALALARPRARTVERVAVGAVFALAAALRFAALGRTPVDPFYDAAVRSMGTSWHAFFVGAFDPSAGLAIDKPPFDLWLQVASTKLFGFGPSALLVPAAVGGTLTVVALYDLLRTLFGSRVALLGAMALAVLPIAVITGRSDTMDSVMAALVVTAFAVAARGLRSGRWGCVVLAGALLGLAFEAKLFEALLPALPLALLWWFGARASRGARVRALLAAGAVGAAVGLAWLVLLTAFGGPQRPWAFGSSDGSAWNAAFVYDGVGRVTAAQPPGVVKSAAAAARGASRIPAGPGPLRLLSAQDELRSRLGIELAAAWASVALVAVTGAWRGLDRPGRAGLAALATWLALGTVLFSLQGALRPRYLEAFDPAIAALLGAAVLLTTARARDGEAAAAGPRARTAAPDDRGDAAWRPRRAAHDHHDGARRVLVGGAVGVALVAVLLSSAVTSVRAVVAHVQDSGTVGALPAARVDRVSAYLRGHQGRARYEFASLATSPAAPLIVHDGRPALVLTAAGRDVVSVPRLARLVAAGQVRTAIVGGGCRTAGCTDLAAWIRAHGVDRSLAAGEPHARTLYALDATPAAGEPRAAAVHARDVMHAAGKPHAHVLYALDPTGAT